MELLMRNKDNINSRHSYQFNGNLQNEKTNCLISTGNLFLNNFSTNKFEIPFMIPSQIQSNIKKKIENFTYYFNRKKNDVKYSMNHWNKTGHSNFITPQPKSDCVSNPIASYLIGGFVGSKSQMNNEKHNLSYDLGGVIFKILNDCKYGKSCEKAKEEKKLEINKFERKSKSFVKNSKESFEYCDFLMFGSAINESQNSNTVINQDNSKDLANEKSNLCSLDSQNKEEKPKNCTTIRLENLTFSKFSHSSVAKTNKTSVNDANLNNISDENPIDQISMDISKIEMLQEALLDYRDCNASICGKTRTSCNSDSDTKQNINNEKNYININSTNTEHLNVENTKTGLNLAASPCTCLVNSSSESRTRQCSECSIESTDSESFIVFDDRCDSSFDELQSSVLQESENDDESDFSIEEEEEEESDNDSVDNESDFCCIKDSDESDILSEDKEVAEANARWAKSYRNVTDDLNGTGRKVRFSEKVAVHRIIAWDYAYRAARIGPWEQIVRDRIRFRERIQRLCTIISPVLLQSHREKIYLKFYV